MAVEGGGGSHKGTDSLTNKQEAKSGARHCFLLGHFYILATRKCCPLLGWGSSYQLTLLEMSSRTYPERGYLYVDSKTHQLTIAINHHRCFVLVPRIHLSIQ